MVNKSMIENRLRDSYMYSMGYETHPSNTVYFKTINDVLKNIYDDIGDREKMRNDTFFKKYTNGINKELVNNNMSDGLNLIMFSQMMIPSYDSLLLNKIDRYFRDLKNMAQLYDSWDIGIKKVKEYKW